MPRTACVSGQKRNPNPILTLTPYTSGGKKREEREVSVRLFLLSDMLLIVSPNIGICYDFIIIISVFPRRARNPIGYPDFKPLSYTERTSSEVLYRLERELPLSVISEVRLYFPHLRPGNRGRLSFLKQTRPLP